MASEGEENVNVRTANFSVRCRGRRLVKLISNLNDAQRESVKRIGFGGLLELKITQFPLKYVPLFLKAFNDGSHVFRASRLKEFLVTKHDVHDCFLLPLGPTELQLIPTGPGKSSMEEEIRALKEQWRERFDVARLCDPIPLGKVYTQLEGDVEGGDDFCKMFVLFSMSSFLCPTSNNGVDLKLLRAVEDVGAISKYDWCSYVLHGVVSAALEAKNSPRYVLGCIPFLMITYFQRFIFRGEVLPHDLPLIRHWDEDKIVDRLKGELVSGSLGRQTWSSVRYPRCLQSPTEGIQVDTPVTGTSSGVPRSPIFSTPRPTNERKSIQIDLPPGVEDDVELHARAVDGLHELYLKMQRNAIAFHAWYSETTAKIKRITTQPIEPVVLRPSQSTQAFFEDERLHRYVDEIVAIAARMKASAEKAPVFEARSAAGQSSEDEEDFHNARDGGFGWETDLGVDREVQVADVDQVRDVADQGQEEGEPDHCHDEGEPDQSVQAGEADVGVPLDVQVDDVDQGQEVRGSDHFHEDGEAYQTPEGREPNQIVDEMDVVMNIATLYSTGELNDIEKGGQAVEEESVGKRDMEEDRSKASGSSYIPHSDVVYHPFLFHSNVQLSAMVVVPENMGCSIDCGSADPKQPIVSDFLCENISLFSTVFSLRKEVMDYVFYKSNEYSIMETLVQYKDVFYITREDMASLQPGAQVLNIIIECWCLLLNHLGHMKSAPVPSSRCFFGLAHTGTLLEMWKAKTIAEAIDGAKVLFETWDLWIKLNISPFELDSDMVFVPILSGDRDHYSCACINFLQEQVEYLDNRAYGEDFESLPYAGLARIAADQMGNYMLSKGLTKGSKVQQFKLKNVEFSWQKVGQSFNNCGVYLMVHMMLYCGTPFECGLGEIEKMPLYRAEITAILLLADVNRCRGDLLASVSSFNKFKDQLNIRGQKEGAATSRPVARRIRIKAPSGQKYVTAKVIPKKATTPKKKVGQRKATTSTSDTSTTKRKAGPVEEESPSKRLRSSASDTTTATRALSAVKSPCRGKGDGLGCSLDCDAADPNSLMVAKVLRNNHVLLKGMAVLRKHVVDYSFLDDYNMDPVETLACFGSDELLCRDDIMSMLPGHNLTLEVIECWSMLLNRIEKEDYEVARMTFFGLRHMDAIMRVMATWEQCTPKDCNFEMLFNHWDAYVGECGTLLDLHADLLIVPLNLDCHFCCVCVNHKTRTVDVLDPHFDANWKESDVYKASTIIAASMSDYLETKDVPRASEIVTFSPRQIAINGQLRTTNYGESGIITMMYMLLYEGGPIEHPDLDRKVGRRYLSIQLAATLLLADMNTKREELLAKVNAFVERKLPLWEELHAQRRISKILAQK